MDQGIEILIITSSYQKNWTVPKGNIDKGYTASESAAKEAFEEAGITGTILKPSIGFFVYKKYKTLHNVKMFLFNVSEMLDDWPEKNFRKRKWVSLKKAGNKIRKKSLKELFEDLQDHPHLFLPG